MYVHAEKTPLGFLYTVYFNGERLRACIEADSDRGWARFYEIEKVVQHPDGHRTHKLKISGSGVPVAVVKFGQVEIRAVSDLLHVVDLPPST